MNFKPGMHQLVNQEHVDFDAIIAKMVGVQPQITFPMMGWGKRSFIKATLPGKEGTKIEIEIFTEVTFPRAPPKKDIGYVIEDSIVFQGVQILDYEKDADSDGYHANRGEIIKYQDFVAQHITEPQTRIVLDRIMEHMAEATAANEQLLERINNIWSNRDPGETELYPVQYM